MQNITLPTNNVNTTWIEPPTNRLFLHDLLKSGFSPSLSLPKCLIAHRGLRDAQRDLERRVIRQKKVSLYTVYMKEFVDEVED